ncbi:trans-sialidase [Trypanosoma cruzi]|nr:trans-sialidase [Trypanosoma cruzi]
MKLSYTADVKWVTEIKNKITKSSTWEPNKEYQVALTLHGKKVFFCIDGKLLGEEEVLPTDETSLGPAHFCFGACGQKGRNEEREKEDVNSQKMLDQNSPVTVTNVFLYNHPLNFTEMTAIKDRVFISTRGPESVAGWKNGEKANTTEHAVVVSLSSAGTVGVCGCVRNVRPRF